MFKSIIFMCTVVGCLLPSRIEAGDAPKVLACGEWSKPVTDNLNRAVRGRLVLCEKPGYNGRREVAVYVELQDAREAIGNSFRLFCDFGRTDFRPEYKSGLRCEMLDKDKRPVPSTSYPFSGAVPLSEWVTIHTDATIRLRASPYGIHREKSLGLSPQLGQLWVIPDGDLKEYFLSGTFAVDPPGDRIPPGDEQVWRGIINLPPVRIVNGVK